LLLVAEHTEILIHRQHTEHLPGKDVRPGHILQPAVDGVCRALLWCDLNDKNKHKDHQRYAPAIATWLPYQPEPADQILGEFVLFKGCSCHNDCKK